MNIWKMMKEKFHSPEPVKVTIHEAQSYIDDVIVTNMIFDFEDEFFTISENESYHVRVKESPLCMIGPLQSMIGLAIKNGHLKLGDRKVMES